MFGYIKRHKFLVALFIVILVLVIVILRLNSSQSKPVSTPVPTGQGFLWTNFTPGVTQKNDVFGQLGQPLSEQTVNSQTLDSFKSNSPTRDHSVFFDKNTATFFRQIVAYTDKITVPDILAKYGSTQDILYGPDTPGGFVLYVYSDKGFAYLGNDRSGTVIEVWYFKPTDFKSFQSEINSLVPGYSTTEKQVQ